MRRGKGNIEPRILIRDGCSKRLIATATGCRRAAIERARNFNDHNPRPSYRLHDYRDFGRVLLSGGVFHGEQKVVIARLQVWDFNALFPRALNEGRKKLNWRTVTASKGGSLIYFLHDYTRREIVQDVSKALNSKQEKNVCKLLKRNDTSLGVNTIIFPAFYHWTVKVTEVVDD